MISAVVLTHNDEEILPRCLESVSWCDEIIVIDDSSTDGTVAIAKKFEAKTYIHPLHDDFAAQRNFGLSKAKGPASTRGGSSTRGGDWILFVDSDEEVTKELAEEIQLVCHAGRDPASSIYQKIDSGSLHRGAGQAPAGMTGRNGYLIKRKDYFLGKWLMRGETANVKLLRLARKDTGKWVQPVHEQWNIQGNVGELSYPLLHYPHQNVVQFLNEINRYSSLYAQYLFHAGVKEPGWHIIGKPVAKFLYNYIWRLGFLDGTAGIVAALMMSFHSFLVRGKLWQLHDVMQHKNV